MRIKRLDLKAFGPFTNCTLAFDTETPGLHIIFGPNEAGKSSSLRALKALLYGFPERTPDNFLHAGNQLLVCGTLEGADGRTICFQRRKKRKGDIIDADGNTIDANLLAPFLQGVESELFENLYGIDHETLVRGGEEILARKGEVGQALFAAGAGLSSLGEVVDALENEASDLFKSAGKLPRINTAIKRYKELQKVARDACLSSKEWKDHQRALALAEDERAGLERERAEKSRELRRLERLERAIPQLGALKNLRDQQNTLGHVVVLPPDFSDRYARVVQEIRDANFQLERDSERLKRDEENRNAISFNKDLLDHAGMVDDFHQRLGEYRKGQKDKPERNGMRIAHRKEAALLLKQVRPDMPLEAVESLRPALSRKRTIQALGTTCESIHQQVIHARQQHAQAAQALQEAENRLAAMPETVDTRDLLQSVRLAQKAGQVDEQLEKNRHAVEEGRNDCLAELRRLGLWAGELADLISFGLPLSETVKQFEAGYSDIADRRRALEKDRETLIGELKTVGAEWKKLAYAGEVPSEAELIRTREKREQGWRLLRRQWLHQEAVAEESRVYDPDRPLPDAYEGQVGLADHIADRLRREAERVAADAAFRARTELLEARLLECDRKQAVLDQREKVLNGAWADAWKPLCITPLSPREMAGWLSEMDKLRYRAGDILKKEQENGREAMRRDGLCQALRGSLAVVNEVDSPTGEAIGPVLVFAEAVLEKHDRRRAAYEYATEKHENALSTMSRAADYLKTAEETLSGWRSDWRKALSAMGLDAAMSPNEAIDMMDALQACFDQLKNAEDLQKRIDGIDRDAEALVKEVCGLAEKVTPELGALPVDQTILQLRNRVGQAEKDRTLHQKITNEIDLLRDEIASTAKKLDSAYAQLNELISIAGCGKPEALAETISRSAEYERLRKEISDTISAIGKIGEGVSLEALARQAAEIEVDALPGLIAALQDDIDRRINPEISRVSEIIGNENRDLAAMDGSGRAAEAASAMEQELTRIRRLSERYVRVRLASSILRKEIERYREAHQDPVLKIASRYFADLTLGSFAGLRTDVDDSGNPLLVGIRPDGAWISVAGMSSGARDQLYLSLRLATLEWRLESSEPMPFIVDDILINFDDDRSKATLQALAELSVQNQVILFTHHGKVLEEAKRIKKGTIQIHHLAGRKFDN